MKTYKKDNITVREHDDGSIEHYDENNNLIYEKYANGDEYHYKYDQNNNVIYRKWSDGSEFRAKYDENGNRISMKYSNGKEYHWKYDEKGNKIYEKLPSGKESFYIKRKKVTKEEWINNYICIDFDYRYIFDIIETLKEFDQNVNIENIKQHLNGIDINDLVELPRPEGRGFSGRIN